MIGTSRLRSIGLLLLVTALIVACAHSPADAQRGRGRGRGPQLKIGQVAPDIELSPLVFAKNDKGEMVGRIGDEKVKLSSYKGKAPVCIFSSSYT